MRKRVINEIHNQFKNDNVQLFPNPTTGKVEITGLSSIGQFTFSVISADGKVVQLGEEVSARLLEIDLSNQPNGLYMIELKGQDAVVRKRILKE